MRLPISALVVSCDEGHLLGECLDSLSFCDERIVVDLESRDDTAKVAAARGARVIRHARVPAVEQVRVEVAAWARHDWVLFLDPDERVLPALAAQIGEEFPWRSGVAVVRLPWRFLFAGRPLRGTGWGGARAKQVLLHRRRAVLSPDVHVPPMAAPGYFTAEIRGCGDNVIEHHWMRGYGDWLARHRRYVALEGRVRPPPSLGRLAVEAPLRFAESFVLREGYRDGATGALLSAFWAGYNLACGVASRRANRVAAPPA